MNRKLLILYCLILLFVSIINVNAADGKLEPGDIEIDCVYDSGITISAYYSGGSYSLISSDIKLSNKVGVPYSNGMNTFYNEAEFAKEIIQSAACPSKIYYGTVRQYTKDGSASVSFSLYYRTTDKKKLDCGTISYNYNDENGNSNYDSNEQINYIYCKTAESSNDFDKDFFTSRVMSGFYPYYGFFEPYIVEDNTILKSRSSDCYDDLGCTRFSYNLVNEKVYFTGDVTPLGQWAFKSEGEQAASKIMYAKLYQYKLPNGNDGYFIEKNNNITKVTDIFKDGMTSVPNTGNNYLCLRSTNKEINSDKNDVGFSFSYIRHNAALRDYKPNCINNHTLYKEVDWSELEDNEEGATSICDIIPNTALILAEIINIVRIVVPAFLIVLTGIDISRIVIAGKLDEELPKRRKNIIVRFVVALVFFFLPILVQVIVSSSYGVDFGDVSCIWK